MGGTKDRLLVCRPDSDIGWNVELIRGFGVWCEFRSKSRADGSLNSWNDFFFHGPWWNR